MVLLLLLVVVVLVLMMVLMVIIVWKRWSFSALIQHYSDGIELS